MTTSPSIRTGAMRHRAELQAKSETPDDIGGVAVAWVTERHLWCQIRPLSGSQRLEGMRRESATSHEIFTRYAEDVAPENLPGKRLLFQGQAYNIEAAWSPEEGREFVQMLAARGVAT